MDWDEYSTPGRVTAADSEEYDKAIEEQAEEAYDKWLEHLRETYNY